ncbi:hypothetical protein ACFWWR_05735, partial [Streptomyces sp. NPDC058678]
MSANTWRQPTGDSDLSDLSPDHGQAAPSTDGPPSAGATAAVDESGQYESGRSARRFWSARRIPAALAALLSAAAVGFLL